MPKVGGRNALAQAKAYRKQEKDRRKKNRTKKAMNHVFHLLAQGRF